MSSRSDLPVHLAVQPSSDWSLDGESDKAERGGSESPG